MNIVPLGKIAPAAAGTPVQCTADRTIMAKQIIVSQIVGTTGATYFGKAGMLRSPTYSGVIKQFLAPGASGFADTLVIDSGGGNPLVVADYWVDAANNNEGLLISYVVG